MTIQYNTAALQRQWPIIANSRLNALKRIIGESYFKATGLAETAPPELWRFTLGKSEPRTDLVTQEGLKHQKEIGKHIRQYNPAYDADIVYKEGSQLMKQLNTTTLGKALQGLATRTQDQAELNKHAAKLLALDNRPPITRAEYDQAGQDSDDTVRLLLQHWIQDPPRQNWAFASLCFYSNGAMAKLLYFFAHRRKQQLPLGKAAAETERIKQLYRRMGLVPANPRIIRDVRFKGGKPYPVVYDTRLKK